MLKNISAHRRSAKVYDSNKNVSNDLLNELFEFTNKAPSSMNIQPWRALVVSKHTNFHSKLLENSFGQKPVETAPYVIYFITPTSSLLTSQEYLYTRCQNIVLEKHLKLNPFANRKEILESEIQIEIQEIQKILKSNFETSQHLENWADCQAYIALGALMYGASILKIDSTAMEGFNADEIKKIFTSLSLMEENERVVVACALGYRKDSQSINPTTRLNYNERFKIIN